jgi:hypothetical protein
MQSTTKDVECGAFAYPKKAPWIPYVPISLQEVIFTEL